MTVDQAALFDAGADAAEREPTGKTHALAGFIAGWRWPGAGSFDRLPKVKQTAALRAAQTVERFLEEAE